MTDAVAWAKGDGRDVLVVEDGAPVHKITNLVAEGAKAGVINITHPGNSPDLHAIESCWAVVKDRLRLVDGFVQSFEERRKQVVAAQGVHTQFYILY